MCKHLAYPDYHQLELFTSTASWNQKAFPIMSTCDSTSHINHDSTALVYQTLGCKFILSKGLFIREMASALKSDTTHHASSAAILRAKHR